MEKERRTKALVVVVLLIVIAGLTIAFAALSTTLNINGTAYLDAAKWGIKFENLSEPVKVGTATTTGTAKIEETKSAEINGINVSLSTPGDKVVYTVDLVNEGTINAKIDKIEKTKLTSGQQKYLTFKVTDKNGREVSEGDILSAGETRSLTITIEFIKDLTKEDLPTSTSTISLSYKLNFVQTDEKTTSAGQGSNIDKTYAVGDEFCLGDECFYTIKDNGDTVDALAKYNINIENNEQSETSPTVVNFSSTNYWVDSEKKLLPKYGNEYPVDIFDENSLLYGPLKKYENKLKTLYNKENLSLSLMTQNQLINLGCDSFKFPLSSCANAPKWVLSEKSYWISTTDDSYYVFVVYEKGITAGLYSFEISKNDTMGLRPVITISKSEL